MFDFENLQVYQKAKSYNKTVSEIIEDFNLKRHVESQLSRASFSILLNIAEGSGRLTKKDKRHFYVISRGSVFECVAIFDFLHDAKIVADHEHKFIYNQLEELSKMLLSMIKSLS